VKGIGTSAKIYANDNQEKWMIPPFQAGQIDNGGIDYSASNTIGRPPNPQDPGEVGNQRQFESTSETAFTNQGSTAVSVTRSFWMMVRSGDITVKQYICPSSGDTEDPTEDIDLYYDFSYYGNISYGYQVPFGPRDTQPREGLDNRQVLAADKGPFYLSGSGNPSWKQSSGQDLTIESSPNEWKPYNSANHGGASNGEGQNCLFADGHASFLRTPCGGIDSDNVYTVMTNEWHTLVMNNRIHGYTVHEHPSQNPYPGQDALGTGPGMYASTDSLIYP
jgi:prepilin-type processing-associated H-X9-DG protein